MKKVLVISSIIFLFSFLTHSCNKSETINISNDVSALLDDLKLKTQTFKQNQSDKSQKYNSKFNWKRLLAIAGADFTGALSGAATGFAIGTAAPGVGNGVGLLLGATVGAAGSSMTAASKLSYTYSGVVNPNGIDFSEFIINSENIYDHIGLSHYQLCNSFIALNNQIDTNGFYDYGISFITSRYDINNYNDVNFNFTAYNQIISASQLINEQGSYADNIHELYKQRQISEIQYTILKIYTEAFESMKDIKEFCKFSIIVENIISSTEVLSPIEKQVLLISMSTARCGIQYWSKI